MPITSVLRSSGKETFLHPRALPGVARGGQPEYKLVSICGNVCWILHSFHWADGVVIDGVVVVKTRLQVSCPRIPVRSHAVL